MNFKGIDADHPQPNEFFFKSSCDEAQARLVWSPEQREGKVGKGMREENHSEQRRGKPHDLFLHHLKDKKKPCSTKNNQKQKRRGFCVFFFGGRRETTKTLLLLF